MNCNFVRLLGGTILVAASAVGCAQNQRPCVNAPPPPIWTVKTPFPFQAGTEKSFDQLYHGPWKVQAEIVLYARPHSHRVIGTVKSGTVVEALVAESIVVHPMRLVAAKDFKVTKNSSPQGRRLATVHKGDVFWVLNVQGEGEFSIWWRCSVVGWDSTEPGDVDPNGLQHLGENEVGWVRIRDTRSGSSGWIEDYDKLEPAQPTTKSIG